MRIVMMGTGPFAAPTFRALAGSAHEVAALFVRPEAPRKKGKSPPAPMRVAGEELGIQIFSPADVNSKEAAGILTELTPDLLVVCDYGQILSSNTLQAAPLGGVNLHASLLPRYRGAAPINWAIYHGEVETGVSVIHMTPRLDAGPVLNTRSTAIAQAESADMLEPRLAELGVNAVLEAIDLLAGWDGVSPIGIPQNPSLATRAPRLKKSDGEVDWKQPAAQVERQVRAMKPWPGTFTHWLREDKPPLRLILDGVSIVERPPSVGSPGEVIESGQERLIVAAKEGGVSIERIQPAGKRVMPIDEFLRGHPISIGECFGTAQIQV